MITHQYHKIDHQELDVIIDEDIDDIGKFISEIIKYSEEDLEN